MGLESTIESLKSQGKAETEQLRKEAEQEAQRMLSEAESQARTLIHQREAEAKAEAQRYHVQAFAREELEARKVVLASQSQVLEEVRRLVSEELKNTPNRKNYLEALIRKSKLDLVRGRYFCGVQDVDLLESLIGKPAAGTVETLGGFLIESEDGSTRIDQRFETILEEIWEDTVREVASTLWPSA